MDYNIVEAGCDELARFVKDGILYHVTKSGGTKNGTVAVKGADVTLKEIVIGTTVTNGKYTYDITEIAPYAFLNSNAEKITIPASVTKIADNAFGSLTEVIYEKQ